MKDGASLPKDRQLYLVVNGFFSDEQKEQVWENLRVEFDIFWEVEPKR